jgi:hypothetical protein
VAKQPTPLLARYDSTPELSTTLKAGSVALRLIRRTMIIVAAVVALAGCTTSEPEPAPAPPPSPFDRAWNAALGAAQDEGVKVTSADRVSGVITGVRGPQEIRIQLQTQADGNVRIEMSARGPKGSDPGLAGRISRAYDRRMGR